MPIHPTAIVAPSARVDESASVGPYCVIGENVAIGPATEVVAHAVLLGPLRLGVGNRIHPFAALGGAPQDLSHLEEPTLLEVGDHNEFREGATVHRGTVKGGGITRVGSHCLIMAATHIAHDCQVGDHVVLTNMSTLGGHVELASNVVLGGHVAVAPFVRIGRGAFVAGGARVEQDVPPYMIAAGDRARIRAPNRVGQKRLDIPPGSRLALKRAYQKLWGRRGSSAALDEVEQALGGDPWAAELIAFLRGRSHQEKKRHAS